MAAKAKQQEPTFEQQLQQLEERIARMESGGISLEEMLAGYEWCSDVLKKLEQQLAQAQQRLTILRRQEDGSLAEESLEETT